MSFRHSGVLLHVTSLPSRYGIGDLGPEARAFADFLARTKQSLWQVLPLVVTGDGHSPYSSPSTFAGNPLLISPDLLVADGLLTRREVARVPSFPEERVEWDEVITLKFALLDRAFLRFRKNPEKLKADFDAFCRRQAYWLDDYALFMAIREASNDMPWNEWREELAQRHPGALADISRTHEAGVERRRFWQFLFDRQWASLRAYCNERGIRIFGDVPIYVAHDSADVWANPELFHLDAQGHPKIVAGVPPDYFSETGQRWGNPIYQWGRMRQRGFDWWIRRMARTLEWVDLVRVDHFRGLEAYWVVRATEETAVNGRWVRGPRGPLLKAFEEAFGTPLPIIAEDLGTITPGVRRLMKRFDVPGMVVLQFGFGTTPKNEYLPHNYHRDQVAYTGTHDNDTMVGWWEGGATPSEKKMADRYLSVESSREPFHRQAIRAVMASVADIAIVPLQDIIGLGSEARMNIPGREDGHWGWRFRSEQLTGEAERFLAEVTEVYGRSTEH
jgi:4-alpha-glucanotransferase